MGGGGGKVGNYLNRGKSSLPVVVNFFPFLNEVNLREISWTDDFTRMNFWETWNSCGWRGVKSWKLLKPGRILITRGCQLSPTLHPHEFHLSKKSILVKSLAQEISVRFTSFRGDWSWQPLRKLVKTGEILITHGCQLPLPSTHINFISPRNQFW